MRILMMAINDPAGAAIRLSRALAAEGRHDCRLVTLETRYNHGWEKDLHLPDLAADGLDELAGLLRSSDVFYFHMTLDETVPLGPFLPADHLAGKAVVHHHHGHPDFRAHPDKYREKYRRLGRKNLLVATPDLLQKLPEARWQPNLVPVDRPDYAPGPTDFTDGAFWEGPLRLTHSPTRKDLKNTDELLAVVEGLKAAGVAVDLDLIDTAPHAECLVRKRAGHACFDHMQGYYGLSSLEALSLGRAVVAGLDDWNRATIREFVGEGPLPWRIARDARSLRARLEELAADPVLRREAGEASRRFMVERWNDRQCAARLADFLDRLE
jgi:glycosyltransferase involved in cell wall biosynthesis